MSISIFILCNFFLYIFILNIVKPSEKLTFSPDPFLNDIINILLIIWECHAMYIDHIHTLKLFADSPPLPYPPNFMFFFFLFVSPPSQISVAQILLDVGPALESRLTTKGCTLKENGVSISQQLSNVNSSSARDGTSCLFSH